LPVVAAQPATRLTRAAEAAAAKLEQGLSNLLDVPALCHSLGVSQNRLAAAFRQRFGCTLARYQLARRIEHAEVLLRTTGRSVQDIGQLVGLPDPHHFNKLVRRETGMSPLHVRRGG
jgi:transcriptional regulator GlxA family with amidase domain